MNIRGIAAEVRRRLAIQGYLRDIDASVEDVQGCLEAILANQSRNDYLFACVKALCEKHQDLRDVLEGRTESLA